MAKIAAGLERAFARDGFAKPSVDDLRDEIGVSLRTLYKHVPARQEMILAALEHRHHRYLACLFTDLPDNRQQAFSAIIERVGGWMSSETAHGCLFHAAVAAAPQDGALQLLLKRHKAEVAARATQATGLIGREVHLMLIFEGLTQSWPLQRELAVKSAKEFGVFLFEASSPAQSSPGNVSMS